MLIMEIKKITLSFFKTLMIALFISAIDVFGQSTPPAGTPFINIKIEGSGKYNIGLQSLSAFSTAWIENPAGTFTAVSVNTSLVFNNYNFVGDSIKVYGNIDAFHSFPIDDTYGKLIALNNKKGPNLTELVCPDNNISDIDSLNIDNCSNLKKLIFANNLLGEYWSVFNMDFPELEYCDLSRNYFSSGIINFNCPNLIHLNISNFKNYDPFSFGCDIIGVPKSTNLEYLNIGKATFTSIDSLEFLTKLKCLNVIGNMSVKNFNFVSNMPLLDTLLSGESHGTIKPYEYDNLYCNVRDRSASSKGVLFLARDSALYDVITYEMSLKYSNAEIARAKNWDVLFYSDSTSIVTIGNNTCSPPTGTPYVNLTTEDISSKNLILQSSEGVKNCWIETSPGVFSCAQTPFEKGFLVPTKSLNVYGDFDLFDCEVKNLETNRVKTIDVSNAPALKTLGFASNKVESLDISNLSELENLNFAANPINSLDISSNTKLSRITCYSTFNTDKMDDFYCSLPLISLPDSGIMYNAVNTSHPDFANIKMTNGEMANARGWKLHFLQPGYGENPEIPTVGTHVCPPPADAQYVMVKTEGSGTVHIEIYNGIIETSEPIWIETSPSIYTFVNLTPPVGVYSADISIPGTSFKIYGNLIHLDLTRTNSSFTKIKEIDLANNTSLTELSCDNNSITSFDLTNSNIVYFSANNNLLTSLNLNDSMEHVSINNNLLESLDFDNCDIKSIYVDNNLFTSLDFSNCNNIENISANNNLLTSLSVSGLSKLTDLNVRKNQLTFLDLDSCVNLKRLYADSNKITNIRNLNDCIWLVEMNVANNHISFIDVSKCTALYKLWCYNNNFSVESCDDLYCILPQRISESRGTMYPLFNSSDINASIIKKTNSFNANYKKWDVKFYEDNTDIITSGDYECGLPSGLPLIKLTAEKTGNINLGFKNLSTDTIVWIEIASGVFRHVNIDSTYVYENYEISEIDVNIYGKIDYFDCSNVSEADVKITSIDIQNMKDLVSLMCKDNLISDIDLSKSRKLEFLNFGNNNLSSVNIFNCPMLKSLYCYKNNFTTQSLDELYCSLPQRLSTDKGLICPAYDNADENFQVIAATTSENAIDKNWDVIFNDESIIVTSGNNPCEVGAISNLIVTLVENNVTLTWDFNAPEFGDTILYEDFDISLPTSWKTVDYDGDAYNWQNTKHNSLYGGINVFAYQGDNAVFSASKRSDGNNFISLTPTNWLISPPVGGAKNLSYMITSQVGGANADKDKIEILASYTTSEIDQFNIVAEDSCDGLYNIWSERNINLPEGAKYIAFKHCNSENQGAVVLDNITFFDTEYNSEFVTYNIYRNDVLIGTTKGKKYFDSKVTPSVDYEYCVKAVKKDGTESEKVCQNVQISVENIVKTQTTIYPNPASNFINVISENANELITISDLSGKIVHSEQTSEKQTSINVSNLNAGMYIVRVGDKVTKFVKE